MIKLRDRLLPLIPQEDLDALDNLRDPAPPWSVIGRERTPDARH
ncbi:MAG: hypothetical protein WDM70_06490 [Nitrosomonadales bacterium]